MNSEKLRTPQMLARMRESLRARPALLVLAVATVTLLIRLSFNVASGAPLTALDLKEALTGVAIAAVLGYLGMRLWKSLDAR